MDLRVARGILEVIRTEHARRAQVRRDEDEEWSGELWVEEDVPFVHELCLTLLVAVWHQIERELTYLAARVTDDGRPIAWKQYVENVQAIRDSVRTRKGPGLFERLTITVPDWVRTLRMLVNCYKHDPVVRPDAALLRQVGLPEKATKGLVRHYAPLPESRLFLEGLALSLGLGQDTDYCAVTEELIRRVEHFMVTVEQTTPLSPVEPGTVSLTEFQG